MITNSYLADKSLGQNFLFNPILTDKIVDLAGNIDKYHIIEIGAGPGILTRSILKKNPLNLTVIEIDSRFIPKLEILQKTYPNKLIIINDNALDQNINMNSMTKLISNLPYNITSKLLLKWMSSNQKCYQYIITIQKEYGEKLLSNHNDKNYCSMTVLVKTYFDIEKLFKINKNAFRPIPKVDGMVISLKPKENIDINFKNFANFIKASFYAPRRTILNNLSQYNVKLNINSELRPENISVEKFMEIYQSISF